MRFLNYLDPKVKHDAASFGTGCSGVHHQIIQELMSVLQQLSGNMEKHVLKKRLQKRAILLPGAKALICKDKASPCTGMSSHEAEELFGILG